MYFHLLDGKAALSLSVQALKTRQGRARPLNQLILARVRPYLS